MASIALQLSGQVSSLFGQLWAQHTLRLKDATNENAAAAAVMPAVDADLQEIVAHFNAGDSSANDAINQVAMVDQAAFSFLRSQVGKPGTAWQSSQPGVCDKTCTVGCCLYNSNIHIRCSRVAAAIQSGVPQTLQISATLADKYGYPGTPGYALTITPPSAPRSIEGKLTQTWNEITGNRESLATLQITGQSGVPGTGLSQKQITKYVALGVAALLGLGLVRAVLK